MRAREKTVAFSDHKFPSRSKGELPLLPVKLVAYRLRILPRSAAICRPKAAKPNTFEPQQRTHNPQVEGSNPSPAPT
jgi:hypothetical protein